MYMRIQQAAPNSSIRTPGWLNSGVASLESGQPETSDSVDMCAKNPKNTNERQVASVGDKLQQDLQNENDDNDTVPWQKHQVAGGGDTASGYRDGSVEIKPDKRGTRSA